MSKRKRSIPRPRLAPTHTVANLTDGFIQSLEIPQIARIPSGLRNKLAERAMGLLNYLESTQQRRLDLELEVTLIDTVQKTIFACYELDVPESEIKYAKFRRIVESLNYERTVAGFTQIYETDELDYLKHRAARQTDAANFLISLNLPELPVVRERTHTEIERKIGALLYQLNQARRQEFLHIFTLRLIRDTQRTILTAEELKNHRAEEQYVRFENLANRLGYTPAHIGFKEK